MAYDALIGTQLANYYIEYALGRGGMAMVYYATDVKLDRPVAVKVIDARLQGNPAFAKRFVDEAKMVASWRHENIIHVYYADNEDELYFFAMEYIEGATLEDLIETYVEKAELIPQVDVIGIGRAVASALDYAHEKGVIHRDVKPSNVMIGRDDRIILADFGLALDMAQGSMGEVFGTPHYIAPEQARHSAKAVAQSDLYALGVVLYQMLTGFVPFDDESATSLAIQHISEPPPKPRSWNPELNQATEDVLLKSLAKEPENRYQTGKSLIDALEDAILHRAVSETPMVDNSLPAPPPPVRADRPSTPKKLSMLSISEMVELELSGRDTPEPTPPEQRSAMTRPKKQSTQRSSRTRPKKESTRQSIKTAPASPSDATVQAAVPPRQAQSSKSSNRGMLLGVGTVLVVAVVAIIAFLMTQNNDGETPPPTLISDTLTQTAVAQAQVVAPTDEPAIAATIAPTSVPTDEPAIAATIVPTDEPAIAATIAPTSVPPTNTAIPTFTPIPPTSVPPTNTTIPTFTPIPPTATPLPQVVASAVAFPNGNLLQLTYNSSTFYMRNASTENVRVSRIAFQAIDSNGNLMFYRFEGNNWSPNYAFVERNGNCTGLEITDRPPWNRPSECGRMNSLITPSPSDDRIFWSEQAITEGAVAFAVFWDDVEIARCAINIGACDVRVGN